MINPLYRKRKALLTFWEEVYLISGLINGALIIERVNRESGTGDHFKTQKTAFIFLRLTNLVGGKNRLPNRGLIEGDARLLCGFYVRHRVGSTVFVRESKNADFPLTKTTKREVTMCDIKIVKLTLRYKSDLPLHREHLS